MRTLTAVTLILCAGLLQACAGKPNGIISPESLIDRSAERVTFSLAAPSAHQDISDWLMKDLPTRVELQCGASDGVCELVAADLERRGIPAEASQATGQPKAVLVYERYAARACDNRYKDNSFNPSNGNYVPFGCSVSTNLLESVANGEQFTNPPMMGNAAGDVAVGAVQK